MPDPKPGTRRPRPATKLIATVMSLAGATGMSQDACRDHLAAGTRPSNLLVAAAWDAELKHLGIRRPVPRRTQGRHSTKRGDAIRSLMDATGLSDEMCRQHLTAGTLPRNQLLAAAWYAEMRRLRLRCPKPPTNRAQKARTRATPWADLVDATGLSEESCRKFLAAGTRPSNPIIASAWDTGLQQRTGAARSPARLYQTASRSTDPPAQFRRLMEATGLSETMCRRHLADGTRPRNALIAGAWDAVVG